MPLYVYRYLVLASAVLLVLTLLVVGYFYHQQATRDLVDMVERQNILIDKMISKTIWSRYQRYLETVGVDRADVPRAHPGLADLTEQVAKETEGLPVLKIKIYDPAGLVAFSSESADIGMNAADNEAVRAALDAGRTSSELSFEDHLSAFSKEVFERDVVETYLPIREADGRISGVFEVYTDVTDAKAQIDATTLRLSLGLVVIFGALYAALVFGVLRRAIAPIRLASRRAARIGPNSSQVRLPTRRMPREILPLLDAINGALDRLDQALDAQRRFAADAAHELLTPLAVLRAQVDAGDPEAARVLHVDIDRITAIVRQLLLLSELDSLDEVARDGATCDLHGVVVEMVAQLAPLADRADRDISVTGVPGPVMVQGCAEVLSGAIRNLIENAIRHTPPGTSVTVDVGNDGRLRVMDKGPGVPAGNREQIFRRFWRGGDDAGGAGLGLSIVRRIVEVVGGKVRVEDAPGGGACFVLELVPAGSGEIGLTRKAS